MQKPWIIWANSSMAMVFGWPCNGLKYLEYKKLTWSPVLDHRNQMDWLSLGILIRFPLTASRVGRVIRSSLLLKTTESTAGGHLI